MICIVILFIDAPSLLQHTARDYLLVYLGPYVREGKKKRTRVQVMKKTFPFSMAHYFRSTNTLGIYRVNPVDVGINNFPPYLLGLFLAAA